MGLLLFLDVIFNLDTVSTNITITTYSKWLFKGKRQRVEHVSRINKNSKCKCNFFCS